jgi:prepilin-type N-terminal cleavage/methylation domain-containing protein
MQTNHLGRSGFTLIETIAVLCVMGLVLGALWVLYGNVTRNTERALLDQQMTQLLQASRDFVGQYNENYSASSPDAPPVYDFSSANRLNITRQLVEANAVPSGFKPDTSSLMQLFAPRGVRLSVWSFRSPANPYDSGPMIGMFLSNLDAAACSDVLSGWAGSPDRVKSAGLIAVAANPPTGSAENDPNALNLFNGIASGERAINSNQISTACTPSGNVVWFWFRLMR